MRDATPGAALHLDVARIDRQAGETALIRIAHERRERRNHLMIERDDTALIQRPAAFATRVRAQHARRRIAAARRERAQREIDDGALALLARGHERGIRLRRTGRASLIRVAHRLAIRRNRALAQRDHVGACRCAAGAAARRGAQHAIRVHRARSVVDGCAAGSARGTTRLRTSARRRNAARSRRPSGTRSARSCTESSAAPDQPERDERDAPSVPKSHRLIVLVLSLGCTQSHPRSNPPRPISG